MVFNTTAAEALDRLQDRGTHYALIKQITYAGMGGIGAWGLWVLGYRTILNFSGFFLGFFTLLLILVFVPGIGQQINGAYRWLSLFGHSFQPSEFVKYLIPIYYIQAITSHQKPIKMKEFLVLLATLAVPMSLILIEPDNGTVAIIFSALVVLFILTRIRWVYWALPLMILMCSGAVVASRMPHVSDRIRIYLHPELDLRGKGHQPYQAKIATGSGGLTGRGLGESLQKLNYLPEARSDYIAAIFAEEFGFLGVIGLICIYMLLGFVGFMMAIRAPDREGVLLIAILTYLICFQAFLNLGVVSGLLPSKGTNLPFFSQGGSSLLANFMVVSIILNVAKSTVRRGNASIIQA
ncbi:MAG: cell division protein FtsW [Simkania sp.]|nr:cell division protein FtsW [Simkania sp.]